MVLHCASGQPRIVVTVRLLSWLIVLPLYTTVSIGTPYTQAPLHDPNLPNVTPKALRKLSDNRIRQDIMRDSQAPYPTRCVCPYQTKDLRGRSCKGRHEVIKTRFQPICYPGQVTDNMVSKWRQKNP